LIISQIHSDDDSLVVLSAVHRAALRAWNASPQFIYFIYLLNLTIHQHQLAMYPVSFLDYDGTRGGKDHFKGFFGFKKKPREVDFLFLMFFSYITFFV